MWEIKKILLNLCVFDIMINKPLGKLEEKGPVKVKKEEKEEKGAFKGKKWNQNRSLYTAFRISKNKSQQQISYYSYYFLRPLCTYFKTVISFYYFYHSD